MRSQNEFSYGGDASVKRPGLNKEISELFSGNSLPKNSYSIAQAYAGHQFGHFTMLGDGRATLIGEHISKKEIRYDMELFCSYFPILNTRFEQMALTLSGGEQQMLAIARGLMSKPKILLLDEPSLGLSPKLVKEIFGILNRLNKDQGVTILLVEQNAKAALDIADFGYVMELGRIVLDGKSSELSEAKDIQEFYLGANQESQLGQKRWKNRKTWR